MSLTFSADEILETAERIERNGQHYYRRAAEQITDEKGRKLLLGLAEMEVHHEQIFKDMRAGLSERQKQPQVYDPNDELAMYIQALADSHIFNTKEDPADTLTGEESLEDILRTAIQLEKDSVLFYQGMAELTPDKASKAKVEQIAKEEVQHVNMLSASLATLRQS